MLQVGVLTSHEGSLLQSLINDSRLEPVVFQIGVVICNNCDANALRRAQSSGIPAICINAKKFGTPERADRAIFTTLEKFRIDLVFLAGYLRPVGPATLGGFQGRILNSHPSLLPKHGGKGMFGSYVFQSILETNDEASGVTIHHVDNKYDTGPTLAQEDFHFNRDQGVDALICATKECEKALVTRTIRNIAENGVIGPNV